MSSESNSRLLRELADELLPYFPTPEEMSYLSQLGNEIVENPQGEADALVLWLASRFVFAERQLSIAYTGQEHADLASIGISIEGKLVGLSRPSLSHEASRVIFLNMTNIDDAVVEKYLQKLWLYLDERNKLDEAWKEVRKRINRKTYRI